MKQFIIKSIFYFSTSFFFVCLFFRNTASTLFVEKTKTSDSKFSF